MKTIDIIQIVLFFCLGIALTPPAGRFVAKVFKGEKTWLHPILAPVEKITYRVTRSALQASPRRHAQLGVGCG
jgi:K+-transporting ATPase ATPase A chain